MRCVTFLRAVGARAAVPRRVGPRAAVAAIVVGAAMLFAAPALAAAPAVTTGGASGLTYQSAVLAGTVDPRGESTMVYFQYGTTSRYGAQSDSVAVPAGGASVPVSITVSGLSAGVTYHYRLVATDASGTALGADRSVALPRIPLSLVLSTTPSSVTVGGSVTLEGTLSGTGNAGVSVQLEQNPYPYTSGFAATGNPEVTYANGSFAFNVLDVTQNTQYRVVARSVVSPVVGVSCALGVTLHARASGTRRHPAIRFHGAISPAEPSARIAFERRSGARWRVVGGTVAGFDAVNGTVTFSKTIRMRRGGSFRALVLPVEGAHVAGYSAPVAVRIR